MAHASCSRARYPASEECRMPRLSILVIAVVVCCACRDAITPSPASIAAAVAGGPAGYDVVDLGSFGGISTVGAGLNDRGQVAGRASVPSGADHAFVWQEIGRASCRERAWVSGG